MGHLSCSTCVRLRRRLALTGRSGSTTGCGVPPGLLRTRAGRLRPYVGRSKRPSLLPAIFYVCVPATTIMSTDIRLNGLALNALPDRSFIRSTGLKISTIRASGSSSSGAGNSRHVNPGDGRAGCPRHDASAFSDLYCGAARERRWRETRPSVGQADPSSWALAIDSLWHLLLCPHPPPTRAGEEATAGHGAPGAWRRIRHRHTFDAKVQSLGSTAVFSAKRGLLHRAQIRQRLDCHGPY